MKDKNHRNPDASIKIFTLLLKLFIMVTHLLKKAKKEPVVISNNEKCERDKKKFLMIN